MLHPGYTVLFFQWIGNFFPCLRDLHSLHPEWQVPCSLPSSSDVLYVPIVMQTRLLYGPVPIMTWDARSKQQGGQRWFHLYPDEKIAHDDELHWTGPSQNWNSMCAECHSTRLEKNYDPLNKTFATHWSEINVSCEACHGPGSDHVGWANHKPGWEKLDANKGLPRLAIEVLARKSQVHGNALTISYKTQKWIYPRKPPS